MRISKAALDADAATRTIQQLRLPELQAKDASTQDRQLFFSFLQGEDTLMVRALGALIGHLERVRFGVELDPADTHVPFLSLQLSPQ